MLCLFCSLGCGPSDPEPIREVQAVTGHLSYRSDTRRLTADLILPDSTTRPPIFQGKIMEPLHRLPDRRFRFAEEVDLRRPIRFTLEDGEEDARFSLRLSAVHSDSLPDTLHRTATTEFAVAERGLAENESLVVSFQPEGRGAEQRILLTGPSRQGSVTLTTPTLEDLAPGNYAVYLIKQQRFRDQQDYLKVSLLTEYYTPTRHVVVE
ncbi:hypothetical protein LEM8419_03056 [Neolewinella maritima]|uniref:DUF4397 domain-containing protein n=1 Tax=Neolewinella maritima TaxID=1383882 RepID=A0ABM9B479_9BACT|nr:hypothetical protein [Neolewinella maritima]CAH1002139.1 hypothetical protein LEM8419_03056 [Neolewinella maritima]